MIDKKFFVALIVVASVFITLAVQAEIKTYTGVGEDYANQYETQEDAKFRALKCAIEDAKKQAGVGLKSYSRSINSELVEDEISTITSNSYKIVGDVKYERLPPTKLPGSRGLIVIGWRATVDVDVDDAEVKDWFKRDADEKKALINRNRAAEEAFNEDIKKANELKRRAANVSTEVDEFDLKHEVEAANNDLQVNQKIEEGNRLNYEEKPDEALEKYGEALEIKFVDAVGEYYVNLYDDIESAKKKAREEALKNAREKVGVYITTNSNGEIETVTAPLRDITEDSYQIIPEEFGMRVRANVRVRYNSDDVENFFKYVKKFYAIH